MFKHLPIFLGLAAATPAVALPFLQLDIAGGVYNTSDESVHNTTNPFTLRALVDSDNKKEYAAGTTYYLAVAVTPQQARTSSLDGFGSFEVDNVSYDAADLHFGVPAGLSPHGIFSTWFMELAFSSLPGKAKPYNVQDDPGGLVDNATGKLLYHSFDVDITDLGMDYLLHFDLYTKKLDKKGNTVVDKFAPFSHDAQDDHIRVPDGGSTLIMLGAVLAVVGVSRRRFTR